MKLLPLVGYKSLRALNAFHTLLLGFKMLPAYQGLSYEAFFESFGDKTSEEKRKVLVEAVRFVALAQDEVEAVISFVADNNGVPYGPSNIRNLNPVDLHAIVVEVCMEIGRMEVTIISEEEKKKSHPLA